jgi:hypothetical protein
MIYVKIIFEFKSSLKKSIIHDIPHKYIESDKRTLNTLILAATLIILVLKNKTNFIFFKHYILWQ